MWFARRGFGQAGCNLLVSSRFPNTPFMVSLDLAVGLGHIQTNIFPTLAVTNKELDVRGERVLFYRYLFADRRHARIDPVYRLMLPIRHRPLDPRRCRPQAADHQDIPLDTESGGVRGGQERDADQGDCAESGVAERNKGYRVLCS